MVKKALILGAGGFIGSHMVDRLNEEGFFTVGMDLKYPEFNKSNCDEFYLADLTEKEHIEKVLSSKNKFGEIYQYAADMGGAGFIFTGDNDADIMHNSSMINLNLLRSVVKNYKKDSPKIFYSSSACIYPEEIQETPENKGLKESDAYPANPDSEYGWEKLFSERLYLSYLKNYGLDVKVARFHNIYGPKGTWNGGREKAPAAICRKVAEVKDGEEIEIWGDGEQTRSFLFIDDCIEATRRLMNSNVNTPINIGSEEMISINNLVKLVSSIGNKSISIKHIDGPLGVRGRNSENSMIREKLNWDYEFKLKDGIEITYKWIVEQIENLN
jgi:GDP-D-mannose 3', 5'-epimerase